MMCAVTTARRTGGESWNLRVAVITGWSVARERRRVLGRASRSLSSWRRRRAHHRGRGTRAGAALRWRSMRPRSLDAILAGALTAAGVGEMLLAGHVDALLPAITLPLAWRRSAPLGVL